MVHAAVNFREYRKKNLHLLLDKQAILLIKISYTKTHLLHTHINEKQRTVGHEKMEKGT